MPVIEAEYREDRNDGGANETTENLHYEANEMPRLDAWINSQY